MTRSNVLIFLEPAVKHSLKYTLGGKEEQPAYFSLHVVLFACLPWHLLHLAFPPSAKSKEEKGRKDRPTVAYLKQTGATSCRFIFILVVCSRQESPSIFCYVCYFVDFLLSFFLFLGELSSAGNVGLAPSIQ